MAENLYREFRVTDAVIGHSFSSTFYCIRVPMTVGVKYSWSISVPVFVKVCRKKRKNGEGNCSHWPYDSDCFLCWVANITLSLSRRTALMFIGEFIGERNSSQRSAFNV